MTEVLITEALRRQFRAYDTSFADWLARNGKTPSCSRGCSACCELLALITWPEALLIAEALQKADSVQPFMFALHDQALAACFDGIDPPKYFERRIRCAFVNGKSECSIYSVRPACCRYHCSFSRPELCEVRGSDEGIEVLDNAPIIRAVLDPLLKALEEQVANACEGGPLPIMVLAALGELGEDVAPSIPTPRAWLDAYGEHVWTQVTGSLAEAREAAARKVAP